MEFVICLLLALGLLIYYIVFPSPIIEEESPKEIIRKEQLYAMKKSEIEKFAREFDIELDRRKTKHNMIEDFYKQLP